MAKLKDLPLDDLYAKEKITPATMAAIIEKEDFSTISTRYCGKVCQLRCKTPERVVLFSNAVDILLIQDHKALPDLKYGRSVEVQERTNQTIIDVLCRKNFQNVSYKVVNLLKCNVEEEDMVTGKGPSVIKLKKCAPYLHNEILLSKPRVIVSIGAAATKSLGLDQSNYKARGEVVWHAEYNCWVVLTLHPKVTMMIRQNSSGQMWGSDFWEVINRDFSKAGRLVRGELTIPTLGEGLARYQKRLRVASSLKEVHQMCQFLLNRPDELVTSFDTETTGLDPWHVDAKLLTIQFGWMDEDGEPTACIIPLWHRENKAYNADEAWEIVVKVLESDKPKVGHNSKFDILYIFGTKGVRVKNVLFDTMLVLHAINSGVQGNYGLKRAVWDWIPETGLGGYEDKLPKLTKAKKVDEEEMAEEE